MERAFWRLIALCLTLAFAVATATARCDGETACRDNEADGGEGKAAVGGFEASVLTCAPGTAVYELYGHTALRLRDTASGDDWVFNFGMFDFRRPNFTWRFILGKTDYYLGAVPYGRFVQSYRRQGRAIEEQVLALRPEETERLWEELTYISSLEDWTYRYNFLYDNCTTRAIRSIEKAVCGRIEWPEADSARTFRTIIHEFAAASSPWNSFGQDLLLGAAVDAPAGVSEQMFSPVYAAGFLDRAVVIDSMGRRPLVMARRTILSMSPRPAIHRTLTPMRAALLLLAAIAGLSLWEQRRRKILRWADYPLMFLQGGAGCIVTLLFCCSEHPAVDSNWLVVLLNPLPLLYIPVKLWRERNGQADGIYHKAMAADLLLFAVCAALSGQDIPPEIYVLAMAWLVRTVNVLRLLRKIRLQAAGSQMA